ncbi:hypothetical protein BKA57DRAFT_433740 [Linnemannia elongata]|nr:hypothetical protein BKA57DRAFT_433740 [Linnemannia elongata]
MCSALCYIPQAQTKVLDPEECSIINEPLGQFFEVLGEERPYTWTIFTTAQQTLCLWSCTTYQESSKAADEQRFINCNNSEWGTLPAQDMCDEIRDFKIPVGDGKKTLGDLYDLTP